MTTILTLVTVLLAFFVWRTYERIAGLTAAMETHSTVMLRLAAKKQGVKVTWWDFNRNSAIRSDSPEFPFEHGDEDRLDESGIYLGLPRRRRRRRVGARRAQLSLT